jgi:hypothetical protein
MKNRMTRYGSIILIVLILCVSLPVAWLEYDYWQHCWFPPSGPNVEIIVSACEDPIIYGVSRDGRYLSYALRMGDTYQLWLIDTVTGTRERDTSADGWWKYNDWWLGDSVRIIGEPSNGPHGGFEIADVSNGSKVSVQWVEGIPGTTTRLPDGSETYSSEVVAWFRNAEQVYYISAHQWAVAIGPNFGEHSENNYILAIVGRDSTNSILRFLKDNQIVYQQIGYPNDGSNVVSHNGRFVIPFLGDVGFYTTDGRKIRPLDDFMRGDLDCCSVYGWAYDDSGIYVQANTQGSGGMFPFPPKAQPIIKLNLPPEYLSPAALQNQGAHLNQARITLIIRVLVLIVLLIAGLVLFWWRKKVNGEARIAK